jgi:hypothetical protein
MDFNELLKDCYRYDTALLLVDCFEKRLISIPCKKTTDAKEAVQLYIQYLYRIYRPLLTVLSD